MPFVIKIIFFIGSVVAMSFAQLEIKDKPKACVPPETEVKENDGSGVIGIRDDITDHECVPFQLCNNGSINTDGSGLIDIRFDGSGCHYLEVCCKRENIVPMSIDIMQSTTPVSFQGSTKASTPVYEDYKRSCGLRNENGVLFGISGNFANEAQYGEFPWMLAILQLDLNTGALKYKCGASLIAPNIALTAAHCVHGIDPINLVVRGGEWDTQTTNEIFAHVDNYVDDIVSHQSFHSTNLRNDVAVLFLMNNFTLTETINTICLPSQDQKYDEKNCFVSGWGKNIFGQKGNPQVILKKFELPTVLYDECWQKLKKTKLGPTFVFHNSFMCAGGEEGKDACQGDGGSPLVCPIDGKPGYYYQAGIVAWGIECGKKDVPGVYVDVAHFSTWINEIISNRQIRR